MRGCGLANETVRERVVNWKSKVFPSSWARYDLAQRGSFRLVPSANRQAALAHDYERMQQMFMSEPTSFAELMDRLGRAEEVLNVQPLAS